MFIAKLLYTFIKFFLYKNLNFGLSHVLSILLSLASFIVKLNILFSTTTGNVLIVAFHSSVSIFAILKESLINSTLTAPGNSLFSIILKAP